MSIDSLRVKRGLELKALRKLKGITQVQIAEICGVSLPTIGRMERGEKNWRVDCELQMLHVLNGMPDKQSNPQKSRSKKHLTA
jgi:transcriptional regulator with XRE-family HTH domain